MPRLNLMHIEPAGQYGCGVPACGALVTTRHCAYGNYVRGYTPLASSGYEFCAKCEEVVYKNHPQPDLLKLARTEL